MNMDGGYVDINRTYREGARVVVAMSGGVDSAVSALLLKRRGYNVIGVTTKNFCYGETDMGDRSCCSVEAIDDARRICDALDVVHRVVDVENEFMSQVIDNFYDEYRMARTPNPCVRCNHVVRFGVLAKFAATVRANHIATGHYARTFRSSSGQIFIARAGNSAKDQSYFLSGVHGAVLNSVLFPLGELNKADVRLLAEGASFPVSKKAESQEVCFIPDGDLKSFLSQRIAFTPGPIVNTSGTAIGEHEGLLCYTIGQRRHLGVSGPRPQYVIDLDAANNILVVGDEEELYHRTLSCTLVWMADGIEKGEIENLTAQIRSRHTAAPVERIKINQRKAVVEFDEPQRAGCPGQTIVFYLNDLVVGSGIIDEVWKS